MKRRDDKEVLDGLLRGKLEGLDPEYQPGNWDQLAHRLDALEGGQPMPDADRMLDETAFDKLHQMQVPYYPPHWGLMTALLDMEYAGARAVLRAKVGELLLLALLLWTLMLTLDNRRAARMPLAALPIPTAAPQAPHPTPQPEMAAATIPPYEANHNTAQPAPDAATPVAPDLAERTYVTEERTNNVPAHTPTEAATPPMPTASAWGKTPAQEQPTRPAESTDTADEKGQAHTATDTPSAKDVSTPHNQETPQQWAVPDLLPYPTLLPLPVEEAEVNLPKRRKPRIRLGNVRVGMMGILDANRIITPSFHINGVQIEQVGRYAPGYGGGITLGFMRGRWEVETGVLYSAKIYQPLPIVVIEGSLRNGLMGAGYSQFSLNTLHIPLTYRYNLLASKSTILYGLVGGSMHLVARADYFVADSRAFQIILPEPSEPIETRPGDPVSRPEPIGREKAEAGVLEGGSIGRNIYISGHVGLGVERRMSSYWSLFAQGQYQHTLLQYRGGIGPFRDRIHTQSLLLGVKVRLGQ